ncbi:MAG: glycoside hydrolase family 15 protein [Phycisphaeraceae bacterium]|nr:glycoside hydrolase family 15 protein [Phycisphaeraceae bacterium]
MPRDLPIGNGDMLVTFDGRYGLRDLYYPFVGKYNHTLGHLQRFGVWADGRLSWTHEDGWRRTLAYRADTLVTDVVLVHDGLGLEIRCADCVDFHEPVWLRKTVVRDISGGSAPRDVRLFLHIDLSIQENALGDTANYDPRTAGLIMYKGDFYFLVNACDARKCGIDHWSIGTKRLGGAEGTWRDAEDGLLGKNAIAQGSVDATVGFNLALPPGGESYVAVWLACGRNYADVARINEQIQKRTPDKFIARTEAYWRLWVHKEPTDLDPLPPAVRDLYVRSQLVLRTQIDNRGAIIAANDTDITHFAGDHYSYCWPRDGALVAHALVLSGQSELSRAFFRYCGRCITHHGYFLHKYTPDGTLASSWHPWVVNGQAVLPIQQDETSLVLWALRRHFETFKDVEFVKPLYNSLVITPAKWIVDYRDPSGLPKPSWDLWEERRGVHTFTVAATIGALRAAAAFATDFGDSGRAAWFSKAAEEMAGALKRVLWSPQHGRFARMATPRDDGSYALDMTHDSANFAVFAFGALPADDPMVVADMRALRARLWCKTDVGGCARYENDYYHQVERADIDSVPGNPWLICTLWHALHAVQTARTADDLAPAVELLEWTAAHACPSGVLAEQFNPHTGEPLSVSPLTWSHATVVTVVSELLRAMARLGVPAMAAR